MAKKATKKDNRGGKRQGAGRPPIGDAARKAVCVTLSPASIARVDKIASRNGVSRSTAIDSLIAAAALNVKF